MLGSLGQKSLQGGFKGRFRPKADLQSSSLEWRLDTVPDLPKPVLWRIKRRMQAFFVATSPPDSEDALDFG